MFKRSMRRCCLLIAAMALINGCWSSKEIEDLSMYAGLALDVGDPTPLEQELERKGATYDKKNQISATIQIVPAHSSSSNQGDSSTKGKVPEFLNTTETGDSLFEIMRTYSTRRERAVIGHHLKTIVVSNRLLQKRGIDSIMDFVLRDNDIRPSCVVFVTEGRALDTFAKNASGTVPAQQLRDFLRNRFRTNRIMEGVNLTRLDALMRTRQSFVLQNVVAAKGELELSGAGVIKGASGKWIGSLSQTDVESISWIRGDGGGGAIKTYDWRGEPIVYEIESMKSKQKAKITGDDISFHVEIKSEGRFIENWDIREDPSKSKYMEKAEQLFEERLNVMLREFMRKIQTQYKVEVAGFGESLRIQSPKTWKKVKDRWDEVFSEVPVTFDIDLHITDFGSSTK
ncbi:germination protein BC [Paenibacillus faecis]|uniref:Ger(x)C family spore germination protein n=1 Tax=Paenibacillus faecis TaxID=862114 RepID=UPI001B0F8FF6|nr:Ger(x)C family spore germination protein [Paenibacillus faecis]GIO83945.1 germination protein BC [Paenibacillus faecis]